MFYFENKVSGVRRNYLTRSFTLVELVIVVAIIALLSGISFPKFSRIYSDAVAVNVVKSFTNFLNELRYYAIENQQVYVLKLQSNTAEVFKAKEELLVKEYIFSEQVYIDLSRDLYFLPDGKSSFDDQQRKVSAHIKVGDRQFEITQLGLYGMFSIVGHGNEK